MTKREKGQAFVRRCKKILESWGYEVATFGYATVWLKTGKVISKRHDPFHCDLVAIRSDSPTRWVQCTLDTRVDKRLRDFLLHPFPENDEVELWQGRERKIVIKRLIQGKLKTIAYLKLGKLLVIQEEI